MRAKFITESNSLYQRAYNITLKQIEGNIRNLRWFTTAIEGIYGALSYYYGLGRNNEVVNGMKDAMYDFIASEVFGGTEPTFFSEESYQWWENLSDYYFKDGRISGVELKDEYKIKFPIFEDI